MSKWISNKYQKFVLNRKGVRELLKSSEMQSIVMEYAEGVAQRAGDGYEATSFVGNSRVMAGVKPVDFEHRRKNLKDNVLLKALR